ncbi:DoxX family protein [Granulicoccus phenolivorans]|uniref:DoxX family protein n=1 Tax=Granulicoccus phenolivorans TaxID=266854 RepID=UPI00040A6150|nr:DoxX family protein [Granulicoccus phenolivorans]
MEPLITLTVVTLALRGAGAAGVRRLRHFPTALRGGLAAMFVLTGVVHFVGKRDELIAMVPDFVPDPGLAVTLSGIAELAGAVGLLIPGLALPAAAGLSLLLIGVFPANVNLALSGQDLPLHQQLPWRTLMQLVFLAATGTVVVDRWRALVSRRAAARRTESREAVKTPVAG